MELFGTAGIRGSVAERVTPELALAVGRAVGEDGREFVVGRDGRVTGPALAAAVEAGLESAGADVRRAGVLPTPALAFASRGRRGVMLTASHNPPQDNGIKVFVDGVEYDRTLERSVEERVAAGSESVAWDEWGRGGDVDPLPAYRDAVVEYAREFAAEIGDGSASAAGDGAVSTEGPLGGMRIAVDCGNGMASLATPQVLRALGAAVVTLNANVDGHFPGRESKPTPESLSDLREFIRDGDDVAFGVGHDGDADRIVIVDAGGEVVHEDTVVAIIAEHYVRAGDAEEPVVVTTPNASARIDERVREAGGRVERVRLGALHEGIAGAEADGGDVVFAAEPWKHIHTAFGGWIDGVASAAIVALLVAEFGLDGLRAPVTERPYRKTSVDCPDEAKPAVMATLEATLPEAFPDAEASTEYGVRLELPDGSWVLVRPSGTEPYVRIYAESEDVDALVERASETVAEAVANASTR
ncbi:phosphohexomutase domain-containing protein [Halegenticoccus soli]|uniref:phosphomannomutase n=1 Tax=Halegenticoccus soli TaxID=1985678 RepID=UPI000C6CCE5F|nr:phosphomannomutase [Halegenticoccus soli]